MTSEYRKNPRPTKPPENDEDRRQELADFLKTRRARVKPPEKGYFLVSRRRTPGLRREEVAEMARVSASWYTWLEQGRDIHPSTELLIRLSHVLQLKSSEVNHLFDLAGKPTPENLESHHEEVPAALEKMVTEDLRVPALVTGVRTDVLLWNQLFIEHFYDPGKIPMERRTMLDMIFTQNVIPRIFPEWKEYAKRTVAEFRWSVGKQVGSPWIKELVGRICKESPEFAQLWRLHDVQERKKSRALEFQHEKNGRHTFTRSIYVPFEAENLRLVILTPVDADSNGLKPNNRQSNPGKRR
jgi:transcriptional regulator with XRE-family HTH domain